MRGVVLGLSQESRAVVIAEFFNRMNDLKEVPSFPAPAARASSAASPCNCHGIFFHGRALRLTEGPLGLPARAVVFSTANSLCDSTKDKVVSA